MGRMMGRLCRCTTHQGTMCLCRQLVKWYHAGIFCVFWGCAATEPVKQAPVGCETTSMMLMCCCYFA